MLEFVFNQMKEEVSYTWTQTPDEVEVIIFLTPENLTSKDVKGKGLRVKYKEKKIMSVEYEGKELLSLTLYSIVEPDACSWTLKHNAKGTSLVVICEKTDGLTWHGWTRLVE
mmetsp:Transcript_13186/g.19229  ORF Transcript_13186/g.19229 Transcript_13186/m.19229 type:complete len:112 (-) Transcript_13186:91-426(-)